jgi:inosine-uridine nucleoside N-ribohydrolase
MPKTQTALVLALSIMLGIGFSAGASERIKVIIDTDVAMGYPRHDVDDGLLLLIALNSPELEILGVTASWGNHDQKHTYAKAREILAAAGRRDIPCFSGADGYKDLGRQTPASRFIAETVLKHPGEVSLLVVGAQTNIATAIMSDPEVAPAIKQVVCMGGTLAPPGRWPFWAVFDLNFGANVAAVRTVMDSGVPMHIAHSALCLQTMVTPARYKRMVNEAPFMRELLAEQTRSWYRQSLVMSPTLKERGFAPWDVTALALLVHPEWFEHNRVRGEVDNKGWGYKTLRVYEEGLPEGQGDFNAPRRVDEDKFWEWFFERI